MCTCQINEVCDVVIGPADQPTKLVCGLPRLSGVRVCVEGGDDIRLRLRAHALAAQGHMHQ